jgi:hypothetical protein
MVSQIVSSPASTGPFIMTLMSDVLTYPYLMATDWVIPALTGSLAVTGTLAGVLLNSLLTQRVDRERVKIEDHRRWLADRRRIYVAFLSLVDSLLDQLGNVPLGSYDSQENKVNREPKKTEKALDKVARRVNNELYPVLGELRLIATSKVAKFAERTSDALMLAWEDIAHGGGGGTDKPTRDLLDATRNAMRLELGLQDSISSGPTQAELDQWPWLSAHEKDAG